MVKIYTTPTCAYCHALMDWLDERGIEYTEIDASKMSDIESVPVTEVDNVRIKGFDRPAIRSALKSVGLWK
ncbi:glutaredoxin family protein [Candidatus Saccharibacteria bacterium]|nr:glutaredoxin family protein [Candidatus Saccharibacteria bacterium]